MCRPIADPLPAMTDKLTDLRRTINQLDDQILDLIDRRMTLAGDIIAAKQGRAAFRPGREAQVIERLAAAAPNLPRQLVTNVWRQLMTASTVLQDAASRSPCITMPWLLPAGISAVLPTPVTAPTWRGEGLPRRWCDTGAGAGKPGTGSGRLAAAGRCVFYRGANALPSVACLAGNADDRPRAFGRGCRRGHAGGAPDSRWRGSRPAAGPDRGSGAGHGRQTPGDRRDCRAEGTGDR